jgi:alpha-L-arabinofuranosidase
LQDINNSGDGGIYAELLRNRAFQGSPKYPSSLDGWAPVGGAELTLKNLSSPLSKALPTSMNVAKPSAGGRIGFSNDGYWGMDVRVQNYTGSFWVKGTFEGHFIASLQSALTNDSFGSVEVVSKSKANEWTEHTFTLVPAKAAPSSNNTFAITFDSQGAKDGSLDFNLISLFPPTYKNRPNGMRIDLIETMEQLNPTFFRLPGGNMLEGNDNSSRWRWDLSIGPLKDRPGFAGVWNYQQTDGLGLMEYMQLGEDLNCEISTNSEEGSKPR